MSTQFDADPEKFDVNRQEDEGRYSVAYVNEERGEVDVYSTGPGGERTCNTVPLDLFKAVAVESDL